MASETMIIIREARGFFVNAFEPRETLSGDMKYSICGAVPKSNKAELKRVQAAVLAAKQAGVKKGLWKKNELKSVKSPLRDGDKEKPNNPEYHGMIFFNAYNAGDRHIPDVYEAIIGTDGKVRAVPLVKGKDNSKIYSGAWYKIDVTFYPTATGGRKQVAVSFNNLMKVRDDENLEGVRSGADAFNEEVDVVEEEVANDFGDEPDPAADDEGDIEYGEEDELI